MRESYHIISDKIIKMGDNTISKPKRKRTAFEDKDKEILCLILKQTDGGRLWKIIKEGTGTPNESLSPGRKLPSCSTKQPTIIVIESK